MLVIAGKGHESGQIVGTEILPFDDVEVAREVIAAQASPVTPLWTAAEAAAATAAADSTGDWAATGVSIDSRTVAPGDLFVALHGPNHDGHDYVAAALRPRRRRGDG